MSEYLIFMSSGRVDIQTIFLVILSLLSSRLFFALFDDPEGPNLLIVVVMAVVLFVASIFVSKYSKLKELSGLQKFGVHTVMQIIVVLILYFCLR